MNNASVGIDIGGTFTDVVLLGEDGKRFFGKTLTTHDDLSRGVFTSLSDVIKAAELDPSLITSVVHGTTLVTNALIERKGAKTALVTTQGFRDSIEIATQSRYDLFDLQLVNPAPLVPRRLRLGVKERTLVDGTVLQSLDVADARRIVEELVSAKVEAVAICFLHSYVNPAHEQRMRELFNEIAPHLRVSISSEVSPEIREYPRACTTIGNVYVQANLERYLRLIQKGLADLDVSGDLLVMLSTGGTASVDTAVRFPIRLLESGPAGGAIAASYHANAHELGDVVVFDMGGTTAKVSILQQKKPTLVHQLEVARAHRFKKGSGIPISVPVIDMIEIGAGGGSIARVDRSGRLKVGPESAGSDPGPVCYGLGGTNPTVTDANLVLGYLDPEFFLGGRMKIDEEAARRAIGQRIGRELGIGMVEAAWGIVRIVTENMANAGRVHAAERGRDLRNYSLFAFGGAGPIHACYLADALHDMSRVIVPTGAGVLSAFGFLTVPPSFDFSRTMQAEISALDWQRANNLLQQMEMEGRSLIANALPVGTPVTIERSCEMRYVGQSHQIVVHLPHIVLDAAAGKQIKKDFLARYRELFDYDEGDGESLKLEVLTWRVRVRGPTVSLDIQPSAVADGVKVYKRDRAVYLAERGEFATVPVINRYALQPGFHMEGPVIVEEEESTLVVPSNRDLTVDQHGNLVVTRLMRN